jgi:SAM-dependent methyltransferase
LAAARGLPVPPPELRSLATGWTSAEWYEETGKTTIMSFLNAFDRNLIPVHRFKTILDFGCGAGRVIRYGQGLKAALYGTDYNPLLVEWCKATLPFAKFQTNGPEPPMDYPVGMFDFVYAWSVFTHLDEAHQFMWMDELSRILQTGGYLIITTHGVCTNTLQDLNDAQRERLHRGGMVVVSPEESGRNACATYHSEKYVREHLAKQWEVVDFLPGGSGLIQDLWLFRKPGPTAASG